MSQTNDVQAFGKLIEKFESYQQAVDAVMALSRILWHFAFEINTESDRDTTGIDVSGITIEDFLQKELEKSYNADVCAQLLLRLNSTEFHESYSSNTPNYHYVVFQPFSFVREFLRNEKSNHDMRFFVMQNIRRTYSVFQSSDLVHLFHLLAQAIDFPSPEIESDSGNVDRHIRRWNYKFLESYLLETLQNDRIRYFKPKPLIQMFLECCRAVGYIRSYPNNGKIEFRSQSIDAEFLVSNLFGLTTQIRGFDELFGGGGVILTERMNAEEKQGMPSHFVGRNIVIMGRYGTGKSMLSLQLAVEVARKGGLAWIMPLEQSAEECLYVLESISVLPNDNSIVIATDIFSAQRVLQERVDHKGVIIILKTIKESYNTFLDSLEENSLYLDRYELCLLCIDPINSIGREDRTSVTELRSATMRVVEKLKARAINLLMVAEEGDPDNQLLFEQNIADTVIHLSIEREHEYDQRYIEIRKSRFQREQRGRHYFSIVPGEGFRISPSPASVGARIRQRSPLAPTEEISFGHENIEQLLGSKSISRGDVIAVHGPRGTYKVPLGLYFLAAVDKDRVNLSNLANRALLVAARDDKHELQYMIEKYIRKERQEKIQICELPHGYVNPGYVFQRIEEEIEAAFQQKSRISRIMIDNIVQWDLSSPFIQSNQIFGDTLIDFLKRRGVTSLINCGALISNESNLNLQKTIIDRADCVIVLDHFEFRGLQHILGKITRTRNMSHDKSPFELALVRNILNVNPVSSLLRIDSDGQVSQIEINLLIHAETDIQQEYNKSFTQMLETLFSSSIRVEPQRHVYTGRGLKLGRYSANDQLKILQLDEFQIPSMSGNQDSDLSILHEFSGKDWSNEYWRDVIPRLRMKAQARHMSIAFPFYENISLLAYKKNISPTAIKSWQKLEQECIEWETKYSNTEDPNYIFFDFPKQTGENYNCLFFEILQEFAKPNQKESSVCSLERRLFSKGGLKASRVFRQLCRRTHNLHRQYVNKDEPSVNSLDSTIRVNLNAQVWRHWYSTLNQMLKEMTPIDRSGIEVVPLPKNFTIAGEWYLSIPEYSAAPSIGLEIIKLLTSREAELERMRLGVGLPTRSSFYGTAPSKSDGSPEDAKLMDISPYFSFDMNRLRLLVDNAFSRSSYNCYTAFSQSLTSYLHKILDIDTEDDGQVDDAIRQANNRLKSDLRYLQTDKTCTDCPIKRLL